MIRHPDFVTRNAHLDPDAKAITCEGRTLTWAEVERRGRNLAAALHGLGVGPGDRVAYLGLNSLEIMECQLAVPRIGAIHAPVNWRLALPEKIACLEDCTPVVLVADAPHLEEARALRAACPSIREVIATGLAPAPADMSSWERLATTPAALSPAEFDALASADEDVAALFYTSGTTGRPKGVMLTHQNFLSNSLAVGLIGEQRPRLNQLVIGPLFHLASGSRTMVSAMFRIHSVVMAKFDVPDLLRIIEAERIQVFTAVPTMLAMMLDHPDFASADLSSLEMITYGASPMPPPLMERVMKAAPGVRFMQAYGMTEASPTLSVLAPAHHVPGSPWFGKLGSVGLPVATVDLRIADPDGNPLPQGETGEILARGPQIMKGYWNQPEATARALEGGFYHTGDAGWLDADGFLHIAGRTREMIISGGENVYPIETENALLQHPCVAQCAVLGLPDATWGERVHAVVALVPGADASEAELIAHCRTLVAGYKTPRSITIRREELPLSATSKIDKIALRRELLAELERAAT
ncbi:MAG: long-chain-fatty-acid--CoA ligase [Albimonas sp.]|uniref:long-chain-fatty-acid--CoA ligase n=1 Tax=Albimonas sp. TaxID=1872425 RepID=UPI00405708E4